MDLSRENKLILRCARINLDNDKIQELRESISSNLDWNYILKSALKNGVSSLFYKNIKKYVDGGVVPSWVMSSLKDGYFDVTSRNLLLREETKGILRMFAKDRISVVTLKGMALLETIYRDIGLRPIGDIDLLIKREELGKIDKVLKQLGFSSPFNWKDYKDICISKYLNSLYYLKGQGKIPIIIHLHWHIINTTVPANLYGDKIEMDKFWEGAEETTIAGVKSLIMAPHHLLIHLSEHILRHSYDRYILFCDIYEAVNYYKKRLDWDLLAQDSIKFNLNKPVYYSLYFTSKFLEAGIPKGTLDILKPSHFNRGEKKIQSLIENNRNFPGLKYFMLFCLNEKFIEKVKFIIRSIFPPKEILALRYEISPEEIEHYHYFLRIKNICKKGLGVFSYFLIGDKEFNNVLDYHAS